MILILVTNERAQFKREKYKEVIKKKKGEIKEGN